MKTCVASERMTIFGEKNKIEKNARRSEEKYTKNEKYQNVQIEKQPRNNDRNIMK